jgi:serine/threonine protein kinase
MSSDQLKSNDLYTIEKNIQSGNFGVVSKIKIKENDSVYALKQINIARFPEKEKEGILMDAIREQKLLEVGIQNVVKSFGSHYDSKSEMFIFSLQLMEKDLTRYVKEEGGSIPFGKFLPIFRDILSGFL